MSSSFLMCFIYDKFVRSPIFTGLRRCVNCRVLLFTVLLVQGGRDPGVAAEAEGGAGFLC